MKNNQLRCKNTVDSDTIVNIVLSEAYDLSSLKKQDDI